MAQIQLLGLGIKEGSLQYYIDSVSQKGVYRYSAVVYTDQRPSLKPLQVNLI